MQQTSHRPATGSTSPHPWVVNAAADGSEIDIHSGSVDGPVVAWCNVNRPQPDAIGCGGDPLANARVMAAAPDMLRLLGIVVHELPSGALRSQIRTFIRNATGGGQ